MFTKPIQYVRITSVEELLKFSYRVDGHREQPLVHWQNNGQIAYTDNHGQVYVTPYRPEIHDLLKSAGYQEKGICVPFSSGSADIPEEYQWLRRIAEQECWAYTYENAFNISRNLRLKEVSYPFPSNLHIKEIVSYSSCSDSPALTCSPMVSLYLMNDTSLNIATYILIDTKTVLLCDEYGRTFLIKSKGVINDFVNALINAGYTKTVNPARYVKITKTFK